MDGNTSQGHVNVRRGEDREHLSHVPPYQGLSDLTEILVYLFLFNFLVSSTSIEKTVIYNISSVK